MNLRQALVAVAGTVLAASASAAVTVFTASGVGENCGPANAPHGHCSVPTGSGSPAAARASFSNPAVFTQKAVEEFQTPPFDGTGGIGALESFDIFRNAATPPVPKGVLKQAPGAQGTVFNTPLNTDGTFLGRFDTTTPEPAQDDSGWFSTPNDFIVDWSMGGLGDVNAFAFYLTDLGDLGGTLTVKLFKGTSQVGSDLPVNSGGRENGRVAFFGVHTDFLFDSVQFVVGQPNSSQSCEQFVAGVRECPPDSDSFDFLGIDSIIVGQVVPDSPPPGIPEPGTIALLTLGGLLAAVRRRRTA